VLSVSENDVLYGFHGVLLGLFDHGCLHAVTGSGPATRPGAGPIGLSARLVVLSTSDGIDLALYDDTV
jgi:hypothetical protein